MGGATGGVAAAQVGRVLDWCHAVHNVSLALEALGQGEAERRRLFKKLRKWLRQGWAGVVDGAGAAGEERGRPAALEQPLGYLRSTWRRASGLPGFPARGLPVGSGAIESAVRRVLNLRLKGAGLLWLGANAEGALVGRAAALTGRWDETMDHVREEMGRDRHLAWEWVSPDMVAELKAEIPIRPPAAQQAVG